MSTRFSVLDSSGLTENSIEALAKYTRQSANVVRANVLERGYSVVADLNNANTAGTQPGKYVSLVNSSSDAAERKWKEFGYMGNHIWGKMAALAAEMFETNSPVSVGIDGEKSKDPLYYTAALVLGAAAAAAVAAKSTSVALARK